MTYVGHPHTFYAQAIFIIVAVFAGVLWLIQVAFLQKLRLIPIYLLPFLSFFICYQNVVLFYGQTIHRNSAEAYSSYVFHSFQIPLFIVILFEITFRLHSARYAHFLFIPFDQGTDVTSIGSTLMLWSVRLVAIGLFIMNILSDFSFVSGDSNAPLVGNGGYIYFSKHGKSKSMILNMIPVIILCFESITIGIVLQRYGQHIQFGLRNKRFWKLPLFGGIIYTICHIFDHGDYSWTSSIGNIILLLSTTIVVKLIQEDLAMTGTFADFLHRSNIAFSALDEKKQAAVAAAAAKNGNKTIIPAQHNQQSPASSSHITSGYSSTVIDMEPRCETL